MDLSARLPEADGSFVGTFVERDEIDESLAAFTFDVETVVKGDFGPTAIVRTNAHGASCGLEFLRGPRTGLLLDRAPDGVWESGLCQQVPPDELLAIAPGAAPPDPVIDPIDPTARVPWWVGAAVGVSMMGAILLLAWRARPRSA